MKRIVGRMAVAGLALILVAGPASAQARGYLGFGAGVNVPVGDFADAFKLGWLGQVVAGITSANGKIGGRIDGSYSKNSVKSPGTGHVSLIGANADIVFTPGKRPAKVHPYFLAGVGFYNNDNADETKFALNGGAGIQIHTGGKLDVYTEARFVSVRTDGASTNFIPITLGLRWGGI